MGALTLDYGQMTEAESAARRAASACDSYADRIESRVTRKLDNLQYGSTGNTSSSSYFANQKIRNLKEKQDKYINFANKMKDAKNYAIDKDRSASIYIRRESGRFRKAQGMEVNALIELFAWLTTTIINKTEFGRWISQKFKEAGAWLDERRREFKRWYELDGGKYIIKTVLSIIGMVLAVAFLVLVAWPAVVAAFGAIATAVAAGAAITGGMIWTAITAAAAFVTAIIAVTDKVAKVYGNVKACINNEEDPGWAKRYGNYSSFSEMLRKELFSSGFANKMSYLAANAYDMVGITAELIGFAGTIKGGVNFIKDIKSKGISHIFDKVSFKAKNGKVTWGTFKYGLKHLFNNVKISKQGINATNISRLQNYYKLQNYSKGLINFEKAYKIADASVSGYDSIQKHGIFKSASNSVIDKILGKSITYELVNRINRSLSNIEQLNKNMRPAY